MADVLEVRITPPFDELDTSSSSSCQDEMDWDDAQEELACLQVEIPYHRVLSPISGLTEGFSSGLQLTESPCPSDSEYVSSFLSTASGSVKLPKPRLILTDASDKENQKNIIIHSPSPTKARSIAKLEVQALEYSQEEPPAKSPRGEDEEEQVNLLYQSDPGDLKHLLRESVSDPRKLHASLPELPAYDGTHSGELKLKPKTRRITRNRSNTGPRIRPPSADNNASPHGTRSSSMRLRKPRSIQQLTKSRPSSPSLSPISSPSLTDRHSFLSESVTANGAVKQPRKISALIPTLAPIPTNTLKPRRESLTKSPRGSPRSSLRASSNILLEASPKRSANWPRSALLRSEGSLPTFPPFPLEARPRTAPGYPFIDNADQDKTQSSNNNHNNNKSKLRGPSFGLIKSQLVTLQGDFSKDFHFTNESANQSEGEQPEAFDLEKEEEEEEEEEEEGFGRTLRRSVSEMDIGQALSNQRKRKLSRRKGHQSAAPCYGASFQSHCDRVRAEQQICQVPTVVSSKHPDLDVIEAHTLMKMLRGEYADCFSGIHVIDCRFPYEYEGGHVVGAFNLHTPHLIETQFPVQKCDEENEKEKKPAIIFHCEFSSERGPKQYRHLRKLDREMNYESYPKLYYPHLFLLAGGYKEFFLKTEGELCEPRNYVEMLDTRYSEEMKRHTSEAKRRSFKKFRSQSYSCLLEIMNK